LVSPKEQSKDTNDLIHTKLVELLEPEPIVDPEVNLDPREIKANVLTDMILRELVISTMAPDQIFKTIDRTEEKDSPKGNNDDLPSFLTKGIETDLSSVDEYLLEFFIKIKEDKELFLDSLSTPLNRDAVEILGHL
jgi:hypothetical protein